MIGRGIKHASLNAGDHHIGLLVLGVVGHALHLGELGGGTQQGRVTAGFQEGGSLVHPGLEPEPLGARVGLDLLVGGITWVGIGNIEDVAELDATVHHVLDLTVRGMAQPDPAQVSAAAIEVAGPDT
jgi:hypothetical protein